MSFTSSFFSHIKIEKSEQDILTSSETKDVFNLLVLCFPCIICTYVCTRIHKYKSKNPIPPVVFFNSSNAITEDPKERSEISSGVNIEDIELDILETEMNNDGIVEIKMNEEDTEKSGRKKAFKGFKVIITFFAIILVVTVIHRVWEFASEIDQETVNYLKNILIDLVIRPCMDTGGFMTVLLFQKGSLRR